MYIVIRIHCLPEDEGMAQFLGVFDTRKEADEFMEEYTKDAYFEKDLLEIFHVEKYNI